jgi:hypothetical protein
MTGYPVQKTGFYPGKDMWQKKAALLGFVRFVQSPRFQTPRKPQKMAVWGEFVRIISLVFLIGFCYNYIPCYKELLK